jgi:FkbM family methyltransferase
MSLKGLGILNYQGFRISGEEFFLSNYISSESIKVVFDVGANVGGYTERLRKYNSATKIYCFEPHPETYKRLQKNIGKIDGIELYNVGLSKNADTLKIFDYIDNDGSSHASLYKEVISEIHKAEVIEHEVAIRTIDDFISEKDLQRVNLLKIDTEGNELNVLLGAREALTNAKIDIIHFEFNEMNVISKTYFKEFWDLLEGYELYRLLQDGLVLIKHYNPVFCEIFAFQNIVAIRKGFSIEGIK